MRRELLQISFRAKIYLQWGKCSLVRMGTKIGEHPVSLMEELIILWSVYGIKCICVINGCWGISK